MAIMTPEERAQLVQQVRTRSSDFNKRLHECGDVKVGAQLRIRMPSNYVKSDGPGLMVYGVDPAKPGNDQTVMAVTRQEIVGDLWPKIYDIYRDERRPATQADIDQMERRIVQLNDELQQLRASRFVVGVAIRNAELLAQLAPPSSPLNEYGETQAESEQSEIERIWDAVKAASER